jgi:TRAP-type C4-dicarboxylate transport system substrate-binding protein
MEYNDELVEEETETSFAILKDAMKVNTLSSSARNEFIKRSQKVYDYFINKGFFTKAELAEIQKAAK